MGVGDFNEYCRRKNGASYTIYPARENYLRDTYGLLVYQEQFLLDCMTYAGWSIAYADQHVRKNKNIKEDCKLKEKFISDSITRGFDRKEVEEVWAEIEAVVGEYSFNKSHAASYAVTSLKTAWFKHYYPSIYYASLLSHAKDTNAISFLVAEMKHKSIQIVPPDINLSIDRFISKNDKVYYKLTAIKDVGDVAYKALQANKPYSSLSDLVLRTPRKAVRSNVVESLIKAGCFDFVSKNRNILLREVSALDDIGEWNNDRKMEYEKDSFGFYFTGHPLDKYDFDNFFLEESESDCLIAGGLRLYEEKQDRNNNTMAFITFDTAHGDVKCLLFSTKYNKKLHESLKSHPYFIIRGKKSKDVLIIEQIKLLKE